MNDDDILFDIRDHAGLVTLNRPKALNALTHGMVTAFVEKLEEWREEDAVRCVVVRAAGEKAFCAGGDIRRIYDQGTAGDPAQVAFFADEYRLNVQIKRYPKPYVALIDGIVMGGASACPFTAATGSARNARCSPCRRRASASFPMSAEPTSCRACRISPA